MNYEFIVSFFNKDLYFYKYLFWLNPSKNQGTLNKVLLYSTLEDSRFAGRVKPLSKIWVILGL